MAKGKTGSNESYKELAESIKAGQVGNFYIFHGDEMYLLERSLDSIRSMLCPEGLGGFNYKRFEGKGILIDDIENAVNTLPVFAERTLVEIHDFDVFYASGKKRSEEGTQSEDKAPPADKLRLIEILSDLPDYVCLIVVFDVAAYKPDGRLNSDKAILSKAQVVEFAVQEQSMLVRWIARHFRDAGKTISAGDAGYLILLTGGLMSSLLGEIGKVAAYATGGNITRADIDAVVTPVLDAVVYKMTDALVRREYGAAMRIMDELLRMREVPQMIISGISSKMRQFLAARVCIEDGLDIRALMDMGGVKHEFQAKLLMGSARRTTLAGCREAVLCCADTALAINSAPEPESRLTELIARLAHCL